MQLDHPPKFTVGVPRHILRAAGMDAKRFPSTNQRFWSCKFPAGVWMMVVDGFAKRMFCLHSAVISERIELESRGWSRMKDN